MGGGLAWWWSGARVVVQNLCPAVAEKSARWGLYYPPFTELGSIRDRDFKEKMYIIYGTENA
jgi:hypothetical protein